MALYFGGSIALKKPLQYDADQKVRSIFSAASFFTTTKEFREMPFFPDVGDFLT